MCRVPSDANVTTEQTTIKQIVKQVLNSKISQLRFERGLSRDPSLMVSAKQDNFQKYLCDFPAQSVFKYSSAGKPTPKHAENAYIPEGLFRSNPNQTVSFAEAHDADVQDVQSPERIDQLKLAACRQTHT